MKRILITITLFVSTMPCFAQTPQSYVIKGTIKGIPNGKVKLIRPNLSDRTTTAIDSGLIKNNKFELHGSVGSPQLMALLIQPGNYTAELFLDKGAITIAADTAGSKRNEYSAYGTGKSSSLTKFTVSGSKNHDQWAAYQNAPEQKLAMDSLETLNKQYYASKDAITRDKIRGQITPIAVRMVAWQKTTIENLVNHDPSSAAGAYMFYNYHWGTRMPDDEFEQMLGRFTGEARNTVYIKKMESELNLLKSLRPGNIAPDFTLMRKDSSKLTLSSTRGKYILIDFWASWCVPCRKAIPHWKEVYQKYHDKGFDILSVSDDDNWANWKKAMDVEQMPWEQVCDEFPLKNMPSKVGTLYNVLTIPHYVLLDKAGKILVNSGDEQKIDEKLNELFN